MPEVDRLPNVTQRDRFQPALLSLPESLAQSVHGFRGELVKDSVQLVRESEVENVLRMAHDQPEVVMAGRFDTQNLPFESFVPSIGELKGREVAEGLGNEAVVGEAGLQPDVHLDTSVHDFTTPHMRIGCSPLGLVEFRRATWSHRRPTGVPPRSKQIRAGAEGLARFMSLSVS